MNKLSSWVFAVAVSLVWASGAQAMDLSDTAIEAALKAGTLVGDVHGAVEGQGLYVLTLRGADFFSHREFPLVPEQAAASEALRQLARHDRVKIKGEFIQHGAPNKHILVRELQVVRKYETTPPFQPYEYKVQVPKDLGESGRAYFKVHAVGPEGKVLVVEYKDVVLPVFVRSETLAPLVQELWRGDKIQLAYKVRSYPQQPAHLQADDTVASPLLAVERVKELHGKAASMKGIMIRFPKSPQVIFDIFALESTDADAVTRDYTLLNGDPEVFKTIREKLEKSWAAHVADAKQSRNRWENPRLKVEAKGTYNVVDPGQANPQIFLKSADDVSVTFEDGSV